MPVIVELSVDPGAREDIGEPDIITKGLTSVTVTLVRVTLPVLVTVNAYVTWSPALWMLSLFVSCKVPVLVNSIPGAELKF